MNCSLLDEWSYNSVTLQLLGAAGAILAMKEYASKSIKVEIRAKVLTFQGLPLTT